MSRVRTFLQDPKRSHDHELNGASSLTLEVNDDPERLEALTPDRSYIVQAPAGSGKTGLLVQRMLALLSVVERPESIVAMTFTIKAAAEMRHRVIEALRMAEVVNSGEGAASEHHRRTLSLARAALARDRELSWGLLEDPSRLHIQTIDALCARLVREMPLVSEAGGIGNVVEDATAMYREAARQALEQLTGSDGDSALFQRLALHFDNDIALLERQIAGMLEKRDQWHAANSGIDDATVHDFVAILERGEEQLRRVFRLRDKVDFIEVTRAAITALGSPEQPSDLLYALDYRIEHLLVDEFQDTSRAQYALLEALTGQWSESDGRTLFAVGDPLQSIYGFRAADVSLYLRCWREERLGAVRLKPLRLRQNFRSTPAIVQWVNDAFTPVLPESNESAGAVKLQPASAARDTQGAAPQLIPFLDDRFGEAEASWVAAYLKEQDAKTNIAILLRSRSHAPAILRALRRAEVRYRAVDIDPLQEQQHILDLLALTRALTHLGDRAAWLACLRAPWCGLELCDLAALVEGREGTVRQLLSDRDRIASLTPPGRVRALRFLAVMEEPLAQSRRVPLRRLVERAWLMLGGPAILLGSNQREDAEVFFSLLEEVDEGGEIRDFAALGLRLEKLYARPDPWSECVQVMTVHEAKGLEFDTVILPGLSKAPRGEDEELLVWSETPQPDGSLRLEVAAQGRRGEDDAKYKAICEARKARVRNEGKRLFYVACTRAKNTLILLGSAKRNKNGGVGKAQSHTFLGLMWDRYRSEFERLLTVRTATQATLFGEMRRARTLRRLPEHWVAPVFEGAVEWSPEWKPAVASRHQVSYRWVHSPARHVGTVVHEVLSRIARDGVEQWSDAKTARLRAIVHADLSRLGLTGAACMQAAQQVLRALGTTLASERGRWILSMHAEAHCEWPIAGLLATQLVSGTIDRAFRDWDGRFWIVDYKTGEHQGGSVDMFIEREQARYRSQLETYAALLSRIVPGPISLGLYFPLLDAWRGWNWQERVTAAGGDLS